MSRPNGPGQSKSARDRGKASGEAFGRLPCSAPPPGTNGKPRKPCRACAGSTGMEAHAWARKQDWWPLVTNHHDGAPYSDHRFYIWILEEEIK